MAVQFSKPFHVDYSDIPEHIRLRDNFFRELEKINTLEAVEFVKKNCKDAYPFTHKHHLLEYALKHRSVEGLILEFGVFKGKSINFIASNVDQEVHGFDSFEGLPEDWSGGNRYVPANLFDLKGGLPKVKHNVNLHKGWFTETIKPFLKTTKANISFLHIDCDIFTSTYYVLDILKERIVKGTLIQFDEFYNFYGWKNHEYKALNKFLLENNLSINYIGFTDRRMLVEIQ